MPIPESSSTYASVSSSVLSREHDAPRPFARIRLTIGPSGDRSPSYTRGVSMTDRSCGLRCLVAVSLLFVAPAFAAAQESRSSQLAAELAMLLDAMKLDSIAANIEGDQYVAALYFSGSQLLVVRARYLVPESMDERVAAQNYREVYIDLNSASIRTRKPSYPMRASMGSRPSGGTISRSIRSTSTGRATRSTVTGARRGYPSRSTWRPSR